MTHFMIEAFKKKKKEKLVAEFVHGNLGYVL